jgi:hypothetical protein
LIRVLNILLAVIGIAVFVGWFRNRRPEDYRDIESREISDDFAAQEELLEDALAAERRDRASH